MIPAPLLAFGWSLLKALADPRVWLIAGIIAAGAYGKGRLDGRSACNDRIAVMEAREAAAQKAAVEAANQVAQELAKKDREAEQANDAKIQELEAYVAQLETRDSECLSAADVERLQNIIGR